MTDKLTASLGLVLVVAAGVSSLFTIHDAFTPYRDLRDCVSADRWWWDKGAAAKIWHCTIRSWEPDITGFSRP